VYSAREGVSAKQSLSLLVRRNIVGQAIPRTVVYLGLTSLFTDISSEMVSAILPLYAVFYLQMTPLAFGLLDGIYQGASGVVRIFSGVAADRWSRHKDVAAAGYGLSAAAKLGLLLAGSSIGGLGAWLLVDRSGKGIRTGPRDALISLASRPDQLAGSFAVHRALDTFGALCGPILAFAVLSLAPGRFDAIFVASFCIALLGLGIIVLFVENRPAGEAGRLRLRGNAGLATILRTRSYAVLLAVASALAVFTVSDGFLYLAIQRRMGLSAGIFPLLYVVTSLFYFVLAIPMGRLADRIGRVRVFVGGYALLPIVYLAVLAPELGYALGLAALFLFGAYYAATDGVLAALGSSLLPPAARASGLSVLSTAISVARLVASVLFGAIWTVGGIELAVMTYAVAIVAAVVLGALALRGIGVQGARA
jgi:MFS family permease